MIDRNMERAVSLLAEFYDIVDRADKLLYRFMNGDNGDFSLKKCPHKFSYSYIKELSELELMFLRKLGEASWNLEKEMKK